MVAQMIVLMRHAKPDFNKSMLVRTSDMGAALAAYDQAGIERDARRQVVGGTILPAVDSEGGSSVHIVTSDLRRSVESAQLFFPHREAATADPLYREAELPAKLPLCGLSMRFSAAVVIARILWMLGIHQQAESYAVAASRARDAAEALTSHALDHDCVILVGHGFFNRLIYRELSRTDWTAVRREYRGFGGCTTFVCRNHQERVSGRS